MCADGVRLSLLFVACRLVFFVVRCACSLPAVSFSLCDVCCPLFVIVRLLIARCLWFLVLRLMRVV